MILLQAFLTLFVYFQCQSRSTKRWSLFFNSSILIISLGINIYQFNFNLSYFYKIKKSSG
ncbi:MAG: hypothetical protein A2998_03475 [Candidatus Staskawiczbacteria bacterium RIFCSPLOWO2_01_FULL_37_25b]|uniref:Uncharacterized protein n=2 Tax=Candidatus Staskawicziibacteriota TaxID=1817916 RepID=A0A1G2HP13_9BACT|nr:MAG: hypothetical protein A2812_02145 [Candidatus Staskawiczbacteria bacterium RIFCSPHIGHO2_01_FULL_36_16]OGZ72298.1 MAG: hypothetical protein A2998_03475 [Candidatus Staskawiczbacteria bacterium RIFCSPLOWO2_01_FULL_37_25b]